MAAPPTRLRYGGSKVRSGCVTCKARHVKCDEGRPVCQRCRKASRECDYTPPPDLQSQRRSRPLTVIHYTANPADRLKLSCYPEHDPIERRAIDFFQHHTAVDLGGHFSSELWSRTLLQVAYHKSIIRHAVVALGSLHEQFVAKGGTSSMDSEIAMQYYCKAIKEVVSLDLTRSHAVDTALVACVLFAAFESLQGHFKSALTHISSGLKLLSEHEKPGGKFRHGFLSGQVLHPTFVRFDSQAMEIHDVSFRPYDTRVPNEELRAVPHVFSSIDDAYLCFDTFFNHLMHFLQYVGDVSPDRLRADAPAPSMQLDHLSEYFGRWSQAFEASHFPPAHPGVLILLIYQTLIDMMGQIQLGMSETGWDGYVAWHTKMVELTEAFMATTSTATHSSATSPTSIVSNHHYHSDPKSTTSSASQTCTSSPSRSRSPQTPTPNHKPTFSLTLGIITPLYMVCTRCRDPSVRRRALHLLSTCHRKEGIWDSAISARVAQRIIAIEEAGAPVAVVTDASQIPESARVRELDVTFGLGRMGRIKYAKSMMFEGANTKTAEVFEEVVEW